MDTSEPKPGALTRPTAKGFAWSFGSAGIQAVAQIIAIAVLSRLLLPREYGLVAAANLLIGFLTMVGSLGVGTAIVQKRQLTGADVAAAFYFSAALGLGLGVFLAAAAPFVGALVGVGGHAVLLEVMALALPIGGLSTVAGAIATRRLQFRALAIADVVSYLGYIAVAIVLAERGAGAWSLVGAQLTATSLDTILYYAIARHRLRPAQLGTMLTSLRTTLAFGSGVSLASLGNWMARNGDSLVVVHTLGLSSLGIYNRAYTFLAQPAEVMGGVADKVLFPAMARIQTDNARLRRGYIRATSCLALVAVPVSVFFFILAPEFVEILAGPKWSAVTGPFRVFALVLLPRTLYKISGSLTRATGAVFGGAWRQWLYSAEVIAGAAVGQMWGATGVAVGASLAIVAHFCVMLKFSGRIGNDLIRGVVLIHVRYALVAVGMAVVCVPTASFLRHKGLDPEGVIAATMLVGGMAEALMVIVFRRFFEEEVRFVRAALRDVSKPGISRMKKFQTRFS